MFSPAGVVISMLLLRLRMTRRVREVVGWPGKKKKPLGMVRVNREVREEKECGVLSLPDAYRSSANTHYAWLPVQ